MEGTCGIGVTRGRGHVCTRSGSSPLLLKLNSNLSNYLEPRLTKSSLARRVLLLTSIIILAASDEAEQPALGWFAHYFEILRGGQMSVRPWAGGRASRVGVAAVTVCSGFLWVTSSLLISLRSVPGSGSRGSKGTDTFVQINGTTTLLWRVGHCLMKHPASPAPASKRWFVHFPCPITCSIPGLHRFTVQTD